MIWWDKIQNFGPEKCIKSTQKSNNDSEYYFSVYLENSVEIFLKLTLDEYFDILGSVLSLILAECYMRKLIPLLGVNLVI